MFRHISTFSLVTLTPTLILTLAACYGGIWAWLAFALLAVINHIIDAVFENRPDNPIEKKLVTALPVILALCHFILFPLVVWAMATQPFILSTKIALFMAMSLYLSTVSNANGHELIHRTNRIPFLLGKWIFITHLFGHHTSAHRLVHHPHVATPQDPNSARYDESFYRFFNRAWVGSFREGYHAEQKRLNNRSAQSRFDLGDPYIGYCLGAFLCLVIAFYIGGVTGLLCYIGLAFTAQAGLLLNDYVQHYGLTRAQDASGKYVPVSPIHSWNAPHWLIRNLTLNAPLHSDHHAKPTRSYTELQNLTSDVAPQLPYSPALMSVFALNPIRWRRMMNPRVAKWKTRHNQP